MSDDEKKRLTLWVDKKVSDAVKKQARDRGVSASAYISMLIMEKEEQKTSEK